MCNEIYMTRTYTLKRRAEQQAETRRRIVEAAVDLHSSVGPALTTFSMVAERAGVQRHTLYAHFPDERSLFLACSGLAHGARSAAGCRALARDRGPARAAAGRPAGDLWLVSSATPNWPPACCAMPNIIALTKEMIEMRLGPVYGGLPARCSATS